MDYEASLCPGCGFPRHETTDPANDGAYEAVPVTCYGCAPKDAERRQVSEAMSSERYGRSAFDGLQIGVVKKEAASG